MPNIPKPHTGSEYIGSVLKQEPTEFGLTHPMRRHKPAARPDIAGSELKDGEKIDMSYLLYKPVWTQEEIDSIKVTHREPECFSDKVAYNSICTLKHGMNLACGYTTGKTWGLHKFSERGWLYRICFLETLAGIPGMVGAMARHCKSLRGMRRDHGWIHTLLEEAENERMHLLISLDYLKPPTWYRGVVITSQMAMFGFWGLTYFCSPRLMHRLVGYLEEQAVATYVELLKDIDEGKLPAFQEKAAPLGQQYWNLGEDATIRDVFAQMCADEANHMLVNHTFADLTVKEQETGEMQENPFHNH